MFSSKGMWVIKNVLEIFQAVDTIIYYLHYVVLIISSKGSPMVLGNYCNTNVAWQNPGVLSLEKKQLEKKCDQCRRCMIRKQ